MKMAIYAAAGGAFGAAARYMTGVFMTRIMGVNFPWGTLSVNIAGSFLMGVLVSLLALRFSVGNEARTFLAIGVLGGFTTFSSFALDFVYLIERKQYAAGAAYLGVSVIGSIIALFFGLYIIRALFAPVA
jgi:CrcB protein